LWHPVKNLMLQILLEICEISARTSARFPVVPLCSGLVGAENCGRSFHGQVAAAHPAAVCFQSKVKNPA
jgi:hypothetical protein